MIFYSEEAEMMSYTEMRKTKKMLMGMTFSWADKVAIILMAEKVMTY